MKCKIWFKDVKSFLFNENKFMEFIPDMSMTLECQLNAVLRFAIYFSIIVFVIKYDYRVFYFPVIAGLITFVIYAKMFSDEKDKKELFDKLNINNDQCFKPTKENPFMNVSIVDMNDFPTRPQACNLSDENVKENVQEILDSMTISNVDDIFKKQSGFRDFYTNAVTTIPNNQDEFARKLFDLPKTRKEQNL